MPVTLLLISDRDQDIQFADKLAAVNRFTLVKKTALQEVKNFLLDSTQTVVFWDADSSAGITQSSSRIQAAMAKLLGELVNPIKVFAITDGSLSGYPYLIQNPVFGHHIFRRYSAAAIDFYSKIIQLTFMSYPFGVGLYFPEGTTTQKLPIKQLKQKGAAVEAIQNFFSKKGIIPRLATLAARSTDELLMNAIFADPMFASAKASGNKEKLLPEDPEFTLPKSIEIELASSGSYVGVSVIDTYGSFRRASVLPFLEMDYQKTGYWKFATATNPGLGLNNIIESGMSLLFVYRPQVRTEVMIFFPKAVSYKEFRKEFQSVSFMTVI